MNQQINIQQQQKNSNYNISYNDENIIQDNSSIDFENILYQALVNEGKHVKVLKSKRQSFTYNEKQLRDAAAAEVALQCQYTAEENEKGTRKRKQMSTEEKSQQNRDRNREHAKNTRLRKKAYVSKLKELVDQLSLQKSIEIKDRITLGKKIYDTQTIRKNIVRTFLSYRSLNIQDPNKWASILDENFIFIMPITPYMSFNKGEVVNSQRIISGITSMIAETVSFSLMIESVGFRTSQWTDTMVNMTQGCRIIYEIGGKRDIISAGDLVICRYFMKSEGHENVGSTIQLTQQGMLQCKFNKTNKIISAEMIFDVMGFMQQYQRASLLSPESSIIPNSIQMAIQPSNDARLIVSLSPPHSVYFINSTWWKLVGYNETSYPSENEYKNHSLRDVLNMNNISNNENQLKFNDQLISLLHRVSRGIPVRLSQVIQSKDNKKIFFYLRIVPLVNDNMEISHALISMYETYPSSLSSSLSSSSISSISNLEGTFTNDKILLSTPAINQLTPSIINSKSEPEWSIFQQQSSFPQNIFHSQNSVISQTTFFPSSSLPSLQPINQPNLIQPVIDPVWGTHLSRTIGGTESSLLSHNKPILSNNNIINSSNIILSSTHINNPSISNQQHTLSTI